MSCDVRTGDILEMDQEVIVNASNGKGYMGGFLGRYIRFKGVAEAINYKTKGVVEKEAKKAANGVGVGSVFVTTAGNLKAKYIFHAVTMASPGGTSKYETIDKLMENIVVKARELGVKTIAVPLLGTGIGGLSKARVYSRMSSYFKGIDDLEITIVIYGKIKYLTPFRKHGIIK
ncbi:RNase III inhibitor [compost metagenome]